MDYIGIIIVIVIVILLIIFAKPLKDIFNNILNLVNKPLDTADKVIDTTGTLLNIDNYINKSAPFCCDVFTNQEIIDMLCRNMLNCNPDCNRNSNFCASNTNSAIINTIKQKPIINTGVLKLSRPIKTCQGNVSEGTAT